MNSEKVEELFSALVSTPPNERDNFISAADYSDAVKDAANNLVKAYESKSDLLNDDLLSDIARIDPGFFASDESEFDLELEPGDRVQNYVIDSVLGTGGMSVVYRATQKEPIKRKVAIKLIRPSLVAPKTVLRFFREQQALALVGHPNIATLYEVGSIGNGLPFAVIEYVNGLPITAFCEKFKMDSRQRIILFTQACLGLHHAHRHQIVHRDVKPDNILVGINNRKPVPKLIDFGIAKINRVDLTNNQTMTQVGQILGSPRYMSPEQFANRDVDARSDVFSAGLVLFEMLARSPYRKGDTTEEIIEQARIPKVELLSVRLKERLKAQGQLENSATFGKESPDQLIKFCKRDLDWIMSKALAKDPNDRYPDVISFVKDLRATLRNQPVSVSRPSAAIRSGNFVRSNLTWLISGAVAILFLTAGIGIYNWMNSENALSNVRREKTQTVEQNAAANELIMRLLASDMYQLTTDEFNPELIPAYQSQYNTIKESGGPESSEDKAVYGILAVLHAMSGDFDRADQLMEQVDDEQKSELRQVREKICSEYAATAKQRLALLEGNQNKFAKATEQMTLGRCYVVWGMMDDAKSLLKESINYYDSEMPGSYQSLVARNTLVLIYEKTNEPEKRAELLQETSNMFANNGALKATERGRIAFDKLEAWVKASASKRLVN